MSLYHFVQFYMWYLYILSDLESFIFRKNIQHMLRVHEYIKDAAIRSKAHSECICDNHRNLAMLNFFIWLWWSYVRQNWIINSILDRFRNPIQVGFYLFKTTLMSIQRNICFVQECNRASICIYLLCYKFFYIVIIKKYSVQICLICLTKV